MTDSQFRVYILIITNLLAKMYPNIIVLLTLNWLNKVAKTEKKQVAMHVTA